MPLPIALKRPTFNGYPEPVPSNSTYKVGPGNNVRWYILKILLPSTLTLQAGYTVNASLQLTGKNPPGPFATVRGIYSQPLSQQDLSLSRTSIDIKITSHFSFPKNVILTLRVNIVDISGAVIAVSTNRPVSFD